MKKLLTIVFALLPLFLMAQGPEGEPSGEKRTPIEIGGLKYYLDEDPCEATVADDNQWTGELEIPSEVGYNGHTYPVTYIYYTAFLGCETLTKVRIPKSVRGIYHYAGWEECKNPFIGCINLEAIEVEEENPNLCSVDGVLFSHDMTQLYCYPPGAKNETYIVPDGVTWLGGDVFAYNPYLLSVQMPNNVTHMSFGIFGHCTNLMSVRLSENIKHIAACTFEKCENLKLIDIPENVESFEEDVFRWSPIDIIIIRGTFPNGLRKDTFDSMDEERTIIYCQPSEIDKFKKVFKGSVLPLESYTAGIVTKNQINNNPDYYNLQGHRMLKAPAQGIYIRNGRKVVIR